MAKALPERFLANDGDETCRECDKVRKLCRHCDRCHEHCECPDECPRCGGLTGVHAWEVAQVQKLETCRCLECIICHKMVIDDHADFGYGLTDVEAQHNTMSIVCEDCVDKKRTPPSAQERGLA
jgi:hypothetical protein